MKRVFLSSGHYVREVVSLIDSCLAALIVPAALAALVSGLDDLCIYVVCLFDWLRRMGASVAGATDRPDALPERRMAIFVPCWHESAVIGPMVEHNVAAIRYQAYDVFIGAYPNDEPTIAAVRELEQRFERVHLAICPHDGPTSKADCLNWVYQRMLLHEEAANVRFDVVVTHDAEDLIHPESLRTTNLHIRKYDMVQIPVLPLATPLWMITHGVYCDEFAEFQLKDMLARGIMGSFIPSNGVGTGYSRDALERLAETESNRIFDPACLTEDYENGIRLHRLGCRQIFVPLRKSKSGFVATREFFPSHVHAAIRQRTRWVTGIALQTWERHGWRGRAASVYWLWRDRKGLIGSPLSFGLNILFMVGVATWAQAWWMGEAWGLPQRLSQHPAYPMLTSATFALQVLLTAGRMAAVSHIYGWQFALGVPFRTVWANYMNASSACRAVADYTGARIRHQPLVWVKTEHAYPSRTALCAHKRLLGEVLVGSGYIDAAQLDFALSTQPVGMRIGEYLVQSRIISADDLYEALSLQQSVPAGRIPPIEISPRVARSLPREVVRQWKVLPYRVSAGNLFLASPEIPTDEMSLALRAFTRMSLRFQLVTPAHFEELTQAFL